MNGVNPAGLWSLVGFLPQGSELGLVLFSAFISDLDKGIESTLSQLQTTPSLGEGVDLLEDRKAL